MASGTDLICNLFRLRVKLTNISGNTEAPELANRVAVTQSSRRGTELPPSGTERSPSGTDLPPIPSAGAAIPGRSVPRPASLWRQLSPSPVTLCLAFSCRPAQSPRLVQFTTLRLALRLPSSRPSPYASWNATISLRTWSRSSTPFFSRVTIKSSFSSMPFLLYRAIFSSNFARYTGSSSIPACSQ